MGQNDSGLFETNLRDERYLPFEGAGVADSEWQFDLAKEFPSFDYETISDLVLHVRYTARAGASTSQTGAQLKAALNALRAAGPQAAGLWRTYSLRHEFPSVWHQMLSTGSSEIGLSRTQFSLLFREETLTVGDLKATAFLKNRRAAEKAVKLKLSRPPGSASPLQLNLASDFQTGGGLSRTKNVLKGDLTFSGSPITISSTEVKFGIELVADAATTVPAGDIDDIFISLRFTI